MGWFESRERENFFRWIQFFGAIFIQILICSTKIMFEKCRASVYINHGVDFMVVNFSYSVPLDYTSGNSGKVF